MDLSAIIDGHFKLVSKKAIHKCFELLRSHILNSYLKTDLINLVASFDLVDERY